MAFATASCIAYISRKGVMMPAVSAGSNQVGASETCEAMVICPSAAATALRGSMPATAAAVNPSTLLRVVTNCGDAIIDSSLCAAFEADVFVGCGIGVTLD